MNSELDKYLTLSQFSEKLGVSIPRVTRLIEVLKIKTYPKGGAILVNKENLESMRGALKGQLIKRGRKKGPKEQSPSAQ